MLDGMRRHKGWLKWSLALVCLAFVFLYVPDFFDQSGASGLPNSVLARVGTHEITTMEFRRIYLQQVQNYRVQTGEEISEDVLRSLGVHRQVLQQLVNQYSALAEAERLGLEVTDAEIRQAIINLPLFQEDGRFVGEERYRQALQFQRPPVTTAQFEEEIRRDLLVRRLQSAVTDWVGVTDEELEAEYRRRNERVSVNVVTFRGDDFRDEVEATDSDVELLYDEESLTYEVPERRQLRFLLIDESAISDSITLTDAEVQDYYDANFSRFSRPGQVRASHILLRTEDQDEAAVEARAAELAAEARAGADFAELARAHSDDEGTAVQGGDLGLFARGRMVPEFEAVAFELEVGAISDPVRSAFGFHVITVTEKQEAATQPLTEVRDLIERTLKQEQAATRSSALANAIAEEVSTPADLDTAAASRGFEVQESGFVSPGEPILGLGLAPQISARAFQLPEGEVAGPIRSPLGPTWVTVVGRQDPYVPPLDDVREQVREDVLRRKALTAARQRAAEAVDVLKAADDFEAAAGEAGWPVGSSEPLSRGGTFPEVGANAAVEALAFSLPVGGVSDVIEAGNAAAIIQVVERQDVVPAVFDAEKKELEAEMLGQRRQQFYSSYLANVATSLAVSIDEAALTEALGA